MRLTQGQVRELVGISEETFRTWRAIFGSLARRKGATFGLGEALALCVVHDLTRELGVRVGQLADAGPAIFDACETAAEGDSPEYLVVHKDGVGTFNSRTAITELAPPAMVVCLRATLDRLRSDMTELGRRQIGLPLSA